MVQMIGIDNVEFARLAREYGIFVAAGVITRQNLFLETSRYIESFSVTLEGHIEAVKSGLEVGWVEVPDKES